MNDLFFKTDEYKDCLDNFEKFSIYFQDFIEDKDSNSLKWVVLTLYMFMQSIFVLTLMGTNSFNVIQFKTKEKIKDKSFFFILGLPVVKGVSLGKSLYFVDFENNIVYLHPCAFGDTSFESVFKALKKKGIDITEKQFGSIYKKMHRMVNFESLYNRTKQKQYMTLSINSKSLPDNNNYNIAISRLIDIRNQFIHYSPVDWNIEKKYVYEILLPCLEISLFLIENSGNILKYKYLKLFERVLPELKQMQKVLIS